MKEFQDSQFPPHLSQKQIYVLTRRRQHDSKPQNIFTVFIYNVKQLILKLPSVGYKLTQNYNMLNIVKEIKGTIQNFGRDLESVKENKWELKTLKMKLKLGTQQMSLTVHYIQMNRELWK